jgi:hypothetical protein
MGEFIRWEMTPMAIIIGITTKIGVIIGIIKITIGIVDHDIKIIILIVLLLLEICNQILILITSTMEVIGIILVVLCLKILQIKTRMVSDALW